MTLTAHESALVVLVPEAEAVAGPCRALYDPSAARGVPAHITVLYPFKPPEAMTAADLDALRQLFARFPAFEFALTEVRRFPNVLYLAPEPVAPFQALTKAVGLLHPEYPPYEGEFDEIIPHLTLAYADNPERLEEIAEQFDQSCLRELPVEARASAVVLMDDRTGTWQVRETFPLGPMAVDRTLGGEA
jgi:2'-5' RNA ligase